MNLMIDKNHENSAPGSSGVPDAGGAIASPDVSKDEPPGTKPENEELEWARRNVKNTASRKVFRKTELHGRVRTREDARKFRKELLQDLKDSGDGEIVARFGTVLREFIDSIIERQNRIEDLLRLQLADLEQRVDELEQRRTERGRMAPAEPEVRG